MLTRADPLSDRDRAPQEAFGIPARPTAMPVDAYRLGGSFAVQFGPPEISPDYRDRVAANDCRPSLVWPAPSREISNRGTPGGPVRGP